MHAIFFLFFVFFLDLISLHAYLRLCSSFSHSSPYHTCIHSRTSMHASLLLSTPCGNEMAIPQTYQHSFLSKTHHRHDTLILITSHHIQSSIHPSIHPYLYMHTCMHPCSAQCCEEMAIPQAYQFILIETYCHETTVCGNH